jgi:hypothetical protein
MANIDTAAMENLLEQLLRQSQANGAAQNAAFGRLAKAAGLDPKLVGDAQVKLKRLGDAAEDSAQKVSMMASVGKGVGSVLADLTSGIVNTVGNLAAFSAKAMTGASTMSDLIMSFKDLPIIGTVAGLFAQLVRMQEENLSTYRTLSKSGINFGHSLGDLRETATELGLTLDQYSKLMTTNSDVFALMGSSANAGAKNFVNINKYLVENATELRNLGFSYEEMNGLTASYVRVMGGLKKSERENTELATKSIIEYGKELDLIARITGTSREQQEKALQEQMQEANWQAFLATQDDDTRKKLQLKMNEALATAGKGGADIVKAAAMGIAVQSQAGQTLYSLAGPLAQSIENGTRQALSAGTSLAAFQSESARRLAVDQNLGAKAYKDNLLTFNALMQAGDRLGLDMAPLAKQFAVQAIAGDKSIEDTIARNEKEKALQAQDAKTQNASLDTALQLEDSMRKLNAAFVKLGNLVMDNLVNPLMKHLTSPEIMDNIGKGLKEMSEGLKVWIPKLFDEKGRQEIIDKVVSALTNIIENIFTKIFESWAKSQAAKIGADYRPDLKGQTPSVNEHIAENNPNSWRNIFRNIEEALGLPPDTLAKPRAQPKSPASSPELKPQSLLNNIDDVNNPEISTQYASLNSGGGPSNSLQESIDRLNTTNAQLLLHMREVSDNTRRTINAVNDANGNLFA